MIPRYTRPELLELWSDSHRYETWLESSSPPARRWRRRGRVPAGTAAAVRAKAAGQARSGAHPRERGAHAPRRDRVPDPRRGAGRRARALAAPRDDVVGRARRVAGDPAGRGGRPDPRGRRSAARRLPPARRRAPRDADDRPLARHPRRADHGRPGVRRLATPSSGARRRRSSRARKEIAVGKIAGAVGTYANLDPGDRAARRSATLGLRPRDGRRRRSSRAIATPPTSWRWRALGTAVERLALDRPPLAAHRGRRGEEAFGKGQKGSSAMPHKKNPILSENLCGLARLLRSYAQRRRSRTWRCGTSATSRTRRSSAWSARRDGPRRLHGPRAPPAWSTAWSSTRARMRENLELTGGPVLQRGGAAGAGAQGDGRARRPTSWCSATRCAAVAGRRASFRDAARRRHGRHRRASTRPRSTAPSTSNTTCATPARSSTARSQRRSP